MGLKTAIIDDERQSHRSEQGRISRFLRGIGCVMVLCTAAFQATAEPSAKGVEFFEAKIRPVLAQDCYECHRSHGKKKGGLALDSRQALLDGGDSGKAVVPGHPETSLLIKAIRHASDDLKMPKSRAKLERQVIEDFEEWVRLGAPDPRDAPPTEAQIATDTNWDAVSKRRQSWWSFQPVRKSDLSTFHGVTEGRHPVDGFLRARLDKAGLSTAPKADNATLIRRLSFALRGLPPTPAEIEAFIHDDRPEAYANLVDSFLASPRFGERWARHWMDWIRYADSQGSEGDPMIPNAWRYRDYLIRALNGDVPYDQLVREHLAGDLLPKPRINHELGLNESALGLGHLRMVFHGFAPTDALQEQVRFTDDEIGVVSKAFLGLTVGCARCHNHKFDPVSQKDYYAWFGVFASCPPAAVAVDAPDTADSARRRDLAGRKAEIKAALASLWLREAGAVGAKLAEPKGALAEAIAKAQDPASLLHPFYLLRQGTNLDRPPASVVKPWRDRIAEASARVHQGYAKEWSLASPKDFAGWRHDGPGVAGVTPAGDFALASSGEAVVAQIYPSGVYSHPASTKDRGVLLSPRFSLDEKYDLWLRVAGDGGAVARYVVRNYPRDGSVFPVTRLSGGQWRWVKLGLDYWQGDVIHVEVSTAADQPVLADTGATRSWFGISDVVVTRQGEAGPPEEWRFVQPVLEALEGRDSTNAVELAGFYAAALRKASETWAAGTVTDPQALFLDRLLSTGLLPNRVEDLSTAASLVASWREIEAAIRIPTRAQGVIETDPIDQPLFVRGDHKQPGEPVPRHFLEAIDSTPFPKDQSGRLQLAEAILRPENPLTQRVIVNRIWHHLFGRGLVGTPDNFGRMGEEPSHPELLDFLAGWFAEHGYSIKSLVRFIVMSEAWQQSSQPPPGALAKDPNNILLSHFNVRRLEAEAVRDALLETSGDLRLDRMYGPPVLGEEPRRSVYVRVKRNELDPFLAAFDAPPPASTTGKRETTNVPGQSLALLNDPFVLGLAEHWAGRMDKDAALHAPQRRIQALFLQALGRSATTTEVMRTEEFLRKTRAGKDESKAQRARLQALVQADSNQVMMVTATVTARIREQRKAPDAVSAASLPTPIAAWDFKDGLQERIGGTAGRVFGNARIENGALALDGKGSYVASVPLDLTIKARTLEAWVQLSGLKQHGGGVMSLQDLSGTVFDAIVFAERHARRWMAGSEFYNRTKEFDGPDEAEADGIPVQVAIVYAADGTISAYRNGRVYGKPYQSGGLVSFEPGKAQVLFGNRHGEPGGDKNLAGRILKARLYDRALSADEIAALAGESGDFISAAELTQSMTGSERSEFERLQADLARNGTALRAAERQRGLSSEWADLAHGMFNLKEFIYIR